VSRPPCPECGAQLPAAKRTGRPAVYCSDQCRRRHGHAAEEQRRRARDAELATWTIEQLVESLRADPLTGP
jgi:hypothetical protein